MPKPLRRPATYADLLRLIDRTRLLSDRAIGRLLATANAYPVVTAQPACAAKPAPPTHEDKPVRKS